jgi:CBS domain containing-hemolysin-like protein
MCDKQIEMKIVTGMLMILGALFSLLMFVMAESAPQQAAAAAPVVIAYVFARGLDNFAKDK